MDPFKTLWASWHKRDHSNHSRPAKRPAPGQRCRCHFDALEQRLLASAVAGVNKVFFENTAMDFSAADFSNSFTPGSGSLQTVQITARPSHGVLTLVSGGTSTNIALNQQIPFAQLGNIVFTPTSGYTGIDGFTWNGTDGTSYAASPAKVNLEEVVVTQAGSGAPAANGQDLQINYTGYLLVNGSQQGTQFETSLTGSPIDFTLGVGQVIPGWDLGLVGMQVGEKRTLYIPTDMAYGAAGHAPSIPANADLEFTTQRMDPTIHVVGGPNNTAINSGQALLTATDGTGFGNVVTGASVTNTFTITSIGNGPLSFTGNPVVVLSGVNADQFAVTQPVIAGNGLSASFTVTYQPTVAGTANATITIPTNDPFNYNYNFNVQGFTPIYGHGRFAGGNNDLPIRWDPATGNWYVTTAAHTQTAWGNWSSGAAWVNVHFADVNGDGNTDIVGQVASSGAWYAAISNGSSFTSVFLGAWSPLVTWDNIQLADINGDGKADIIGRVDSSGAWYAGIATGSGTAMSITSVFLGAWSPGVTWDNVQAADINGDGSADIVGRVDSSGAWYAGIATGSGTGMSLTTVYLGAWAPSVTWTDVMVADINGDGKIDIVGRVASSGAWYAGIATGSGTAMSLTTVYLGAWSSAVTWTDVMVADINGDGKIDIVGRVASSGAWYAGIATGSGTGMSLTSIYLGSWSPAVTWTNVQVLDLNGDGKYDVLGQISGTTQWWAGISTGTAFTNQQWL